jgi:putative phosphoesterase
MKVVICSDSHDHIDNIQSFCDDVVKRDVDYLIHLGDFISTGQTVMKFLDLQIPCYFVRGNNDGEKIVITKKIMKAEHADCANMVFAELELG